MEEVKLAHVQNQNKAKMRMIKTKPKHQYTQAQNKQSPNLTDKLNQAQTQINKCNGPEPQLKPEIVFKNPSTHKHESINKPKSKPTSLFIPPVSPTFFSHLCPKLQTLLFISYFSFFLISLFESYNKKNGLIENQSQSFIESSMIRSLYFNNMYI